MDSTSIGQLLDVAPSPPPSGIRVESFGLITLVQNIQIPGSHMESWLSRFKYLVLVYNCGSQKFQRVKQPHRKLQVLFRLFHETRRFLPTSSLWLGAFLIPFESTCPEPAELLLFLKQKSKNRPTLNFTQTLMHNTFCSWMQVKSKKFAKVA